MIGLPEGYRFAQTAPIKGATQSERLAVPLKRYPVQINIFRSLYSQHEMSNLAESLTSLNFSAPTSSRGTARAALSSTTCRWRCVAIYRRRRMHRGVATSQNVA